MFGHFLEPVLQQTEMSAVFMFPVGVPPLGGFCGFAADGMKRHEGDACVGSLVRP